MTQTRRTTNILTEHGNLTLNRANNPAGAHLREHVDNIGSQRTGFGGYEELFISGQKHIARLAVVQPRRVTLVVYAHAKVQFLSSSESQNMLTDVSVL